MGFGSGGGGFTPSPNNVPGSTKTGTDKDTDVHEFTGSVDITGSLTLNGSAITGGGGGGGTPGGADTQVQFNDAGSFGGSANFTFDGSAITVSDDADVANTLGKAKIGYMGTGLEDDAAFAHRDKANTANYALLQRDDGTTIVNATAGKQMYFRFNGNDTAMVINGAENNNVGINNGTPEARLHVSANTNEKDVFRADGDINNILYVSGSGKVGIGTGTPTAALHVSSSTSDPLFRVDHSTQAGSQPILYVTGSGLVAIGTDSPRTDTGDTNRLHILGESGGDQGVDPAVNSVLVLENNDHAGLNIITPADKSGMLVFGDPGASNRAYFRYAHGTSGGGPIDRFIFDGTFSDSVMTIRRDGDSINIGQNDADHMLTNKAALHISSSTGGTDVGGPVLLRVDHADQPGAQPTLFVTGSGQVGIGTETPDTTLEILSTSTQQKWSYDADSFATLTVADGGDTTLSSSEGGNITLDADDILLQSNGGQVKIDRPGGSTRLQFDVSTSTSLIDNPNNNDIAFRLGTGLKELARFDQSENALLMSGTFSSPGGDAAINFRDTATSIHSPDFNRLAITAPTLEVSGNLHVSGTYGSTAIETLTANGTISANTGLTLIDASSSLAVDNTLLFSIADGTFAGQEKKIRGLIISGSDGANSTGIYIAGTNIDSPPFLGGNGQIVLSSSNPAAGPSYERAGCSLVWDGTKWLPVGNYNFNINATGF